MLSTKCPICKARAIAYDRDYQFCTSCKFYRKSLKFYQKPFAWASDRPLWGWRIPIFLWFFFIFLQYRNSTAATPSGLALPLDLLNFGIHELGHVLFSVFGRFMTILGGSLFQCLFPLLWMIGFLQKRWYFAATMCWCWLATNLSDVAIYVADARARLLPLAVGPAGLYEQGNDEFYDQAHDWYQILSRSNRLESDLAIAQGLRVAATIFFIIGLISGLALLVRMATSSFKKTAP